MKNDIQNLIKISRYASKSIAYIQGGGGNTSVKIDDHQMAVKASGCKLSDMDETEGYVIVDYKKIKDYFLNADAKDSDFETRSGQVFKSSFIPKEGLKAMRPSVEAGFHSALKKYVIHSHSVYANILCCTKSGKSKAEKIFTDISFLWIPYVDPGAKLTMAIIQGIRYMGKTPDVIFMENHGVIVSADDAETAIDLHEKVNLSIKKFFVLTDGFPEVLIEKKENGVIHSMSPYVREYFSKHPRDLNLFREKVLYPDQLVYLNNSIFKTDGTKSDIYFKDEDLCYSISEKQAMANEETLAAYLYVLQSIEEKGMELVCMTYEHQAFILGWESEAYRKSILK